MFKIRFIFLLVALSGLSCVEGLEGKPFDSTKIEGVQHSLIITASLPSHDTSYQIEYNIKGCGNETQYVASELVTDSNEAVYQTRIGEGCYNIDITPYVDSGYTKNALCESVPLTDVQVNRDTSLVVNIPCEKPELDPLDQKLQENDPPRFTQIFFNPSSVVSCNWYVEVCLAAYDKDEMVMDWNQISGSDTEIVVTKQTRFPEVLLECAEFYPSGEGELEFEVTAFDQFVYNGQIEVLEVIAWERGLQVVSRDTKRFKLNAFCY